MKTFTLEEIREIFEEFTKIQKYDSILLLTDGRRVESIDVGHTPDGIGVFIEELELRQ